MRAMVPVIGCYLGLIDGGYGVIEEIKTPAVAGALMSRLYTRIFKSYWSRHSGRGAPSRGSLLHQPRLPVPRLKVLIEPS